MTTIELSDNAQKMLDDLICAQDLDPRIPHAFTPPPPDGGISPDLAGYHEQVPIGGTGAANTRIDDPAFPEINA